MDLGGKMSADDIVNSFLNELNNNPEHDPQKLVSTYFCSDDPPPPPPPKPTIPSVGLANYGPSFAGRNEVVALFVQIFNSFPDLKFLPLPSFPRLYCPSGDKIAILGSITGTHKAEWFAEGHPHHSKPISGIKPDGSHTMNVPACAIFSFDASGSRIANLSIYFDRSTMSRHLGGP
jgi:hypothetical protein